MSENKQRLLQMLPALVSVLAILISLGSLLLQRQTYSDSSTSGLISSAYTDLSAQNPLQAHLFCLAAEYDRMRAQVRQATIKRISDDSERAQLLLEERALAERIFAMNEQYYFLWDQATKVKDKSRAAFLKSLLEYFTERVLINPRLLLYWSSSGGALEPHYDPRTIQYYKSNVKAGAEAADPAGPFAPINQTTTGL